MSIADEVNAALAEAGAEVSGAALVVAVTRSTPASPQNNPYDEAPTPPTTQNYSFNALDLGWVNEYQEGSLVPISVHKLMVGKGEIEIRNSDKISISGVVHEIAKVKPFAPFGDSIYQEVILKN